MTGTGSRRVTVIGWDGRPVGADAATALAGATLVIGGRRHLDAFAHLLAPGAQTVVLGDVHAGIRELSEHLAAGGGPAAVLASGDPGFFGIVGTLSRCLDSDTGPGIGNGASSGTGPGADLGVEVEVLPGMPSVTLAFARAGLPWADAAVVSAHGRQLRRAANVCRAHPLVAVLTGPGTGPAALGAALAGVPRRMFVAEELGLPGERVTWCTPDEAAARSDWREPNVVIVIAESMPGSPPAAPGTSAVGYGRHGGYGGPGSAGSGPGPGTTPTLNDHESDRGSGGYSSHFHGHFFDRDRVQARTPRDRRQNRSADPGRADPDSAVPEAADSAPAGPGSADPGTADAGHADPGSAGPGSADAGAVNPGSVDPRVECPGPADTKKVPWMFPRRSSPLAWALPENAFSHRDSMITKMEVRALALARLGPGPGDLVWDIGAGSGSVAVECAAFGAAAVAVDRSAEAVGTVAANAAAHGVSVQVVCGEAPAVLAGLPDPDAVFVGGGGPEVAAACAARGPRVVVAALAALDRVRPTWEALAAAGMDVGGTQVAASRLRPLPLPDGGLRLAATNPVILVWGERHA